MVAHLGCVAIPLSHNFREQVKGCTTHGETHHMRSKFSRPRTQISTHFADIELVQNWMQVSANEFVRDSDRNAFSCSAGFNTDPMVLPDSGTAWPRWLPRPTSDILNTCRSGSDSRQETGAHFYAQAHISTQPASPFEDARLSLTYEDQIGSRRAEPSPCRGPQARLSQRRLSRLSGSPIELERSVAAKVAFP
jgi:hypothetical protein